MIRMMSARRVKTTAMSLSSSTPIAIHRLSFLRSESVNKNRSVKDPDRIFKINAMLLYVILTLIFIPLERLNALERIV